MTPQRGAMGVLTKLHVPCDIHAEFEPRSGKREYPERRPNLGYFMTFLFGAPKGPQDDPTEGQNEVLTKLLVLSDIHAKFQPHSGKKDYTVRRPNLGYSMPFSFGDPKGPQDDPAEGCMEVANKTSRLKRQPCRV